MTAARRFLIRDRMMPLRAIDTRLVLASPNGWAPTWPIGWIIAPSVLVRQAF
jgi:hypothetical protein